jgi:hypothetical protein
MPIQQLPQQVARPLLATILILVLAGCVAVQGELIPAQPTTDAPAQEEVIAATADSNVASLTSTIDSALLSVIYAYDDAATFLDAELLEPDDPPFGTAGWATDFSRRTVAWDEILSGGPPKDGIPAIDNPTYETVDEAGQWLSERDPVIFFANSGEARAYPLSILMWHEIANDEVGGLPVSVTFCPLCNASIVFARQLDDTILDFGTTGRLRNSDLIMYDRQSETWWQQFTGEAIIGEHVGRQLNILPSQVISFGDYAARFPEGSVLARPAAARDYGRNPYTNYDSRQPFLFNGAIDDRLRATERVVGLDLDGDVVAYPFSTTMAEGAINDRVGETPVVIFHKPGTASALDGADISASRDIGSAAVFDRRVGEQELTFSPHDDGTFRDAETGSTWNILGEAIDGELTGEQLEQIISFDHFWFAWQAFYPETRLLQ